ncbi:lipoprotein insertase outer membrane protein LolB [Otariodibacter oris]|uniref:Outer-membrane lipoprotein LolB n=1 Tax=Otariodibacter oris TaxID=1032623 RepID=A0A420XIB1_9PAST|nr:lipoprotein insertase outer membrane protein LolB [Otariodibacter oris]QGM80738.1 lipoprotein localization factor LolB [Otariodibacter oris]RKR77097.1 outer membrane lipoprotein LolB [Otariodibacter oris]
MKTTTKILSLAGLLVLAGCNSIYDTPSEASKPMVTIPHSDPQWQQHLSQLQKINGYSTSGQFGYISPEDRFSSHFDWQYHSPYQFNLVMSSNLSSKSLKLQRTQQGMTVSDSEGNTRTESDVAKLMEEMIGVSFPIDHFAYWVKGQPEENMPYVVNEKRQLAQFTYQINGVTWNVNFVEYHEDRVPNLPKLISLDNGTQTLKIRIDEWTY